jgi:phage shock protein PspC (stress-responsive transcriptional regulator)
MSPLEYKLGANYRKRHYHAFKHNQKQRDWLWLFAFWVICACNGWLLQVNSTSVRVSPVVTVFFAIFPVTFILYAIYTRWAENLLAQVSHRDKMNDVSTETIQKITVWYYKSTDILRFSLAISWMLLAFFIGNFNLNLASVSVVSGIVYGINIFFFAFVLMESLTETGLFILLFLGVMVLILLLISDWERILRLIWYCNFVVTTNNAGIRLQQYSNSFLKAMIALIGTAALGLAIGTMFAAIGVNKLA